MPFMLCAFERIEKLTTTKSNDWLARGRSLYNCKWALKFKEIGINLRI
jgi:hypothetical protein